LRMRLALAAPDDALANVDLLVLPYGSAFPVEAWKSIERYLDGGGNLLVIGGQPLRVPVNLVNGQYVAATPAGYILPRAGLSPHL
jgi:hypothetical protein